MGTGGGNVPLVMVEGVDTYNQRTTGNKTISVQTPHGNNGIPCVVFNCLQDPVPTNKVSPCLSTGNPKTGQCNLAIVMATQQGNAEIGYNICPTITAAAGMSGNNQPVVCYDQQAYDKYVQTEIGTTLKASGGSYGGGERKSNLL